MERATQAKRKYVNEKYLRVRSLQLTACRFSKVPTVTLLVGAEKVPFEVPQQQLCEVSTFFSSAFNSQFKESLNKSIHLPDDDEETVDLFVEWLYKEKCDLLPLPPDKEGDYLKPPMLLLVFTDKYDVSSLRNYILTQLLTQAKHENSVSPSQELVGYVYSHTCRGSGIRKLLAEWWAWDVKSEYYTDAHFRDWSIGVPEFAADLIAALAKHVPDKMSHSDPFMMTSASDYQDGQP